MSIFYEQNVCYLHIYDHICEIQLPIVYSLLDMAWDFWCITKLCAIHLLEKGVLRVVELPKVSS